MTARRTRTDRLLAISITAVALLPALATTAARWGSNYLPVQDFAVIDLRVRDVWSTNFPLVGAYSRYKWSHPGPMAYWLVAPFSLVTGRQAWATLVGFALLQAVALVLIAVLAWRHHGLLGLTFWLAIASFGSLATGAYIYLQPWNPHVTLPFFTLLVLLSWLIASGHARLLPLYAGVATFLAQTHIGYAPLVVASLVVITRPTLRWIKAQPERWHANRVVRITVILTALLWLPPMLEVILYWPGNPAAFVAHQVLDPAEDRLSWRAALGVLATELRPDSPLLGHDQPVNIFTGGVIPGSVRWMSVPIAGLGLLTAVTRTTVTARALTRAVAAAGIAGVVAVLTLSGDPYPYLLYWMHPLVALLVLTPIVATVMRASRLRRIAPPVLCAALTLPIVIASITLTGDIWRSDTASYDRFAAPSRSLLAQLQAAGEPRGTILLRFAGNALGGVHGAIFDELARNGADVRFDDVEPRPFGRARVADPHDVASIWYVVEEGDVLDSLLDRPGARLLAESTPLTPDEEAHAKALRTGIRTALEAAGRGDLVHVLNNPLLRYVVADVPGVSRDDANRLADLVEKESRGVCRCGVVAFPPDPR